MVRIYRLWSVLTFLALLGILTACGNTETKEQVNNAYASITWDLIRGSNSSEDNIRTNLSLVTALEEDVSVAWSSSRPDIIAENGRVRRSMESDETVTLTAAISKGNVTVRKTFELTVTYLNFAVGRIREAIQTVYPTKDWVISDFIVTDYGARPTPGFDNREAFQTAIDAAYRSGGGVVFIPAGNYEFRSTMQKTRQVRVRAQDGSESNRSFNYEYVLSLPQSVQLRGDWADPEKHDGRVLGTILEVRVGANSANYNGTVQSWWNDPQAGNQLFSTYTSVADRFIEMNEGTGVTNLSIWYPEQNINNVQRYPWTLYQTTGNSATVENVTLVNSYNGFYSAPSELHYVVNSYMTALSTGIEIHVCTDIGRIENIRIDPKYWAASGLPGAPSLAAVRAYTMANGTGFRMHRSDWEYVSHLRVSGYNIGMWVGREPGFSQSPNAQFYGIHIDDCETGLYVQDVNPYGLLFSNSSIAARTAVYFYEYFQTSVQFNGVDFSGPIITSSERGGVVSFENCTFTVDDAYAIRLNNGVVLLSQCGFDQPGGHVYLGRNARVFKSLNSGFGSVAHNRTLAVTNESTVADVAIVNGAEYAFESIPGNIQTDIAVHPRPASNNVLKADFPRATDFTNSRPAVDVSAEMQASLDALAAAGGGTLYLRGGRYLVNNPIVIPSGVELRGTWDVQHHTQSGGSAIFTNYDGGQLGETNASLIQLEAGAGIRGIKVVQANLVEGGYSVTNPRRTPFLIQGQGPDVYVVNVIIPLGDKGIDLFSYDTSRHYVDYFAGAVMRAGIWAGGGADGGYIRNMQFNPHYALRFPNGGQGYPNPGNSDRSFYLFIQGNCSALRFGDVKNQTIFNNFVFGSVYGIHFVRDETTGNYPGEMLVIGHGSDGCTFAMFVEEAGPQTRIIAINSELVNTRIENQPVRAYVRVGDAPNTEKVDTNAQLALYNSAFWGNPTIGAIVNNGIVRFHEANFSQVGNPGIDVRGGSAHVYTSYFAQRKNGNGDNSHARLEESGNSIELTNNFYTSNRPGLNNSRPGFAFGSDLQ
jgi:hypothetical protein